MLAAFGAPSHFQLGYIAGVFARSQNYGALLNTLILALGAGVFSVVLGVPLAWAAARTNMPFRRSLQALVALSYITPPYLTAIAYIILLGPDAGYFNRMLQAITGAIARADQHLQHGRRDLRHRHACVPVHVLHDLRRASLGRRLLRGSCAAPRREASRRALQDQLPLVAPAITGGALLSAIGSMALFGPQAFLGLPAQITFLPTRIYGVIGAYPPRWAEASSLSLTLVVLTALGLLLQRGYLERRSHTTVGGRGLRLETITPRRLEMADRRVLRRRRCS